MSNISHLEIETIFFLVRVVFWICRFNCFAAHLTFHNFMLSLKPVINLYVCSSMPTNTCPGNRLHSCSLNWWQLANFKSIEFSKISFELSSMHLLQNFFSILLRKWFSKNDGMLIVAHCSGASTSIVKRRKSEDETTTIVTTNSGGSIKNAAISKSHLTHTVNVGRDTHTCITSSMQYLPCSLDDIFLSRTMCLRIFHSFL